MDDYTTILGSGGWPNEVSRFDVLGWFRSLLSPPSRRDVNGLLRDAGLWTEAMQARVHDLMGSAMGIASVTKVPLVYRERVMEYVAMEHLEALGQNVRRKIESKREMLYQADLAEWRSKLLEEHASADDAEEFAMEVNAVLSMMAGYVAQKCSGVCVWFTAGPRDVHHAEAVFDIPGRTTMPYSEVRPMPFWSTAAQIQTQSITLNEYKWGHAKDGEPAEEQASDDGCDVPMIVDELDGTDTDDDDDYEEYEIDSVDEVSEVAQAQSTDALPKTHTRIGGRTASSDTEMIDAIVEKPTASQAAIALRPIIIRHHERVCEELGAILEKRKFWFARARMTNYLVNAPKRLHGGVNVDLGCRVVQRYLEFELSNAKEGVLTLKEVGEVGGTGPKPAYIAELVGKQSRMTWNKRASPQEIRAKTQLDHDVDECLPLQWAAQQPGERRGDRGILMLSAKDTMGWDGYLPAGPDGVRLLVVALLAWGWDIGENKREGEVEVWDRLALDFVDVLEVLAIRAGKAVDTRTPTEGKRVSRPTEKVVWANEMKNKGGGRR
ncbi:unnamed protein product [Peniophora sp. CBMAI 1063]|nr:unnamed protein product [Peniophora sp. CBMAI 1063]